MSRVKPSSSQYACAAHGACVKWRYSDILSHYLFVPYPAGLSLSVLKVDDSVLERLDAPTVAPAWPRAASSDRPPTKVPVPLPAVPPGQEEVGVGGKGGGGGSGVFAEVYMQRFS